MIPFGGSGIDKEVYDWIRFRYQEGGTILEIGGGLVSTPRLAEHYTVVTVEDNEKYIGTVPSVRYIYAPLRNGWYDIDAVRNGIEGLRYGLMLVDGPSDERLRSNFVSYASLFNVKVPWVFHDTNRPTEAKVLQVAAERFSKAIIQYQEYPFFGVLV